jgi:hypothetical protein
MAAISEWLCRFAIVARVDPRLTAHAGPLAKVRWQLDIGWIRRPTRSASHVRAALLDDRSAAFRPTRSRYLKDLPAVRPLSKQEQVDPTAIDTGFARARQSEIRPE